MARSARQTEVDSLLHTFKEFLLLTVQPTDEDVHDLTQRQLTVFLIIGLEDDDHTVRGLAKRMQVAKPAITRALDRLEEYELVKRVVDPDDRRSIFATRTRRGSAYLKELSRFVNQARKTEQPTDDD